MSEKLHIEYPALIYKSRRNNNFIANCIMYNLIGFGKTEKDAIENLEKSMTQTLDKYEISIKPMYEINLPFVTN
ncbi:MAG: hypothetical protein PHV68_07860 [Candidatus Gastranaerophilales bacterium]|nr:hypothetical protein [Candidatus Gastranaerophilales bacterium]